MFNKLFNSQIILIISCVTPLFAETVCDDWQTYKDEKCIKVFEELQTYDEANKTCIQNNSTLVTITSLEEQNFIKNYLYTTKQIVENIWTGLRYVSGKYKWNNELDVTYAIWAEGNPKNKSDYCVQIDSDDLWKGNWSDISCAKKNLALCQKMPALSLQQLQTILMNTRRQFENEMEKVNKQLDYFFSDKWSQFKTFLENNTRKALIYPYKTQVSVLRTEAVEICRQNNAKLVDIESIEKQKLVHSFLYQINPKIEHFCYWIGGYYDSGKFKWSNSGNEFKFSNWAPNFPANGEHNICIYSNYSDTNDGKWYSDSVSDKVNVFCEITFNF